jgi:hypothetical protein
MEITDIRLFPVTEEKLKASVKEMEEERERRQHVETLVHDRTATTSHAKAAARIRADCAG